VRAIGETSDGKLFMSSRWVKAAGGCSAPNARNFVPPALIKAETIDPKVLREDPDRVRAAQAKRGLSDDVVDRALAADAARRSAIATFEARRAEQKQLGKQSPFFSGL